MQIYNFHCEFFQQGDRISSYSFRIVETAKKKIIEVTLQKLFKETIVNLFLLKD